jgi:hypothetical protein
VNPNENISTYINHIDIKSVNLSTYPSMALQPFVGPWQLFQFLNPIYSRSVGLLGFGNQHVARPLPTQRTT